MRQEQKSALTAPQPPTEKELKTAPPTEGEEEALDIQLACDQLAWL